MRVSKVYEYEEKDLNAFKRELLVLYKKLQNDFGTEYSKSFKLIFDFDKDRFSGLCSYTQKQIRLNEYRMIESLQNNSKEFIFTVLIHEFCHALSGEEQNYGHSFNFYTMNVLLYAFYGYNPDHSQYNHKEEIKSKLVNPAFLWRYARLVAKHLKGYNHLLKAVYRLDARFSLQNDRLIQAKKDRFYDAQVLRIIVQLSKDKDEKINRLEKQLTNYKKIEAKFYYILGGLSLLFVPTLFKLV
ncbi:SprT-like domain-containing protein [Flavobacterium sp.]|jgi:hypothetical protein|uniref:SprT-like domain-containing protein n=1 Tax=Flavobacterium sp. TaxID=239 RepID=UPI0037BFBCF4